MHVAPNAMPRLFLALLIAVAALAGWLLLWPVDVDPAPWQPAPAPSMTGVYESNTRLRDIRLLELPDGAGPEDVDVDRQGRIYGGLLDGRVMRWDPRTEAWSQFADTGGRPLGLDFDATGDLYVADAHKGLLRIDPAGRITTLATEANGLAFGFTDDVAVAPDGKVYFSDASSRWPLSHYREDALEHRPYGRLLRYDPETGHVSVLLDDLYFANGVAVSPDGRYVLVNETWEYRVRRYWLAGERAGTTDILADNLPGFPDGVSTGTDGIYWVALASPRNSLLDATARRPWLRRVIARLPASLQPDAIQYGFILGLDENGRVVHNLQDPDGSVYAPITSVEEHLGTLYLGSLSAPAIGLWTASP